MINSENAKQSYNEIPVILLFLGSLLILVGLGFTYFIVNEVLSLYQDGLSENIFIHSITVDLKDSNIFIFGKNPLLVSKGGAIVIAFIMFLFLVYVGIHLALSFINMGIGIVSPKGTKEVARLDSRIDNLRQLINEKKMSKL